MSVQIPTFEKFFWPTLKAIKALGGSGTKREILEKLYKLENFSEDQLNYLDPKSKNPTQPKIEYNAGWARWYLTRYGALEKSSRQIWSITDIGEKLIESEMDKIAKAVRKGKTSNNNEPEKSDPQPESTTWQEELLKTLQSIAPDKFERLCQRLLREAGFTQVNVTGKSGDEGIDGLGVLRINLLSFRVAFQAKRYQGSVGSPMVRNFRGSLDGRVDKGLLITTGSFTNDAWSEAVRPGALAIDLIDGEELCELLKKYGLGIDIVETVIIKHEFFNTI